MNAAARSIACLRRTDHITDTLASFHWLRAPERITFKLAVMFTMALLRATCPNNFVTLLTRQPEPVFGHRLPVFLMFAHLAALLLVTAHLLQLVPGTLSCYYCNIGVVISSKTEDTLISAVIS